MKRILLAGLASGVVSFVVGTVLYMIPGVADLYAASTDTYCAKSMDVFGGLLPWLFLMFLSGVFTTIFLAVLYSYAEKGIPVKGAWRKGLLFGLLIWFIFTLPAAFNTWLLHNYPDEIVAVEAFNGLAGGLAAGLTLAVVYEKVKYSSPHK